MYICELIKVPVRMCLCGVWVQKEVRACVYEMMPFRVKELSSQNRPRKIEQEIVLRLVLFSFIIPLYYIESFIVILFFCTTIMYVYVNMYMHKTGGYMNCTREKICRESSLLKKEKEKREKRNIRMTKMSNSVKLKRAFSLHKTYPKRR